LKVFAAIIVELNIQGTFKMFLGYSIVLYSKIAKLALALVLNTSWYIISVFIVLKKLSATANSLPFCSCFALCAGLLIVF
jgi:hypothetical protein